MDRKRRHLVLLGGLLILFVVGAGVLAARFRQDGRAPAAASARPHGHDPTATRMAAARNLMQQAAAVPLTEAELVQAGLDPTSSKKIYERVVRARDDLRKLRDEPGYD